MVDGIKVDLSLRQQPLITRFVCWDAGSTKRCVAIPETKGALERGGDPISVLAASEPTVRVHVGATRGLGNDRDIPPVLQTIVAWR